jgi:tetratricopeptide (TPR) repeat protein
MIEIIKVCLAAPGLANEVDELNRQLTAELPKLAAAFPDSSDCQWRSAMIYRGWALELFPYSAHPRAVEDALTKATEFLEKLALSNPKRPNIWWSLADTYVFLGGTYWWSGMSEDAEEAYRRAVEIYDEHGADIAADPTPNPAFWIAIDYVQLGYFLADTHREDRAVEFVQKAAVYAKRVENPVDSIVALGSLAHLQLRLGDVAGYRETCKALVAVPVADADILTKGRRIFTLCCAPDALDDMSLVVERADELVAGNSLGQRHAVLYLSGAALYRAGRYAEAAERLENSIAANPSKPALGSDMINHQRLFLAMTKWQLGQKDEARRLLDVTPVAIEKDTASPLTEWNRRATFEVLRREADALIAPKEADEAVENDGRRQSDSRDNNRNGQVTTKD